MDGHEVADLYLLLPQGVSMFTWLINGRSLNAAGVDREVATYVGETATINHNDEPQQLGVIVDTSWQGDMLKLRVALAP